MKMSARFLAWYTCGVLALASALLSLVSVAPSAEARFAALQAVLGGAALGFAAVGAILSRLPREHWANQSFAVRCLLSAAAIVSSLVVVISIG
jgi:hypothetical protein